MKRSIGLAMLLLACLALGQEPLRKTTIGMRVTLDELPIPGPQLEAKPVADAGKAEAIVRVRNVFPHGSGFRYNLEITPFVAGDLDLRRFLQHVDGSPMDGVPAIPIEVGSVRPADQVEPLELKETPVPWFGGYTLLLVVGGVLWVVGLILILFVGRKKRRAFVDADPTRPVTLADRLQPLVEAAQNGDLSSGQQAELERLLVAHWRRRRDLEGVPAVDAIRRLRQDQEAGPLLQRLEEWLHRPGPSEAVDVVQLLAPYRDAPAQELPQPEAAS